MSYIINKKAAMQAQATTLPPLCMRDPFILHILAIPSLWSWVIKV